MSRWLSSIDMIRYAIADQVRSLGGSEQDVEQILRGTRLVVQSLCDLGLVGRGPL